MSASQRAGEDAPREAENVASATECTGLMPALPQDAAEDAAQARLYAIHPGKGRVKRRAR